MRRRLSAPQTILISFAALILLGALGLTLPCSSRGGQATPFGDCLFTATSAVCVTGLVLRDTATYWSPFGQGVILLLIQLGGMGVVTAAAVLLRAAGRQMSLRGRSLLQDAASAPELGSSGSYAAFILRFMLLFELAGAALLSPVFVRDYGWGRGLWMALFHSVSAFCNAGFDLLGEQGAFCSLTPYVASPLVNLVIMLLITAGGLGFLTWEDILKKGLHFRSYRFQSKLVLLSAVLLIVFPALYFYFCELWALPAAPRLLAALFQSVTPRTAGFNTVDLTAFSETGQLLLCLLMLTGGAPGSTAGGMKTTTAAVLLLGAAGVFRRREHGGLFGRRVAERSFRQAAALLLLYGALFFLAGALMSRWEGLSLLSCLFECASALGTVGLSLGLTPQLCGASRLLLMLLMFLGRVGGLTLFYAALPAGEEPAFRLPEEEVNVG
ncbi:MAG: Trk family potassium uptake protein [Oscillospiraceae bacterium]|nr:Trk family potassium uptake protein [Oscillospiraceae bacterium]